MGISVPQRQNFIAGYLDCYSGELKDPPIFTGDWRRYEVVLTQALEARPADRVRAVADLLEEEAKRLPRERPPRGGESYSGTHEFFNGDYWRMLEGPERVGFVQGYLECYGRRTQGTDRFSKEDDWYVAEISRFLGIKGEEMDLSRERVAIAEALKNLKDK